MNLQYLSDSKGQTTGVFIPINEWNKLKSKYKDIEREDIDIPEWHQDLVRQRLDDFKKSPVLQWILIRPLTILKKNCNV